MKNGRLKVLCTGHDVEYFRSCTRWELVRRSGFFGSLLMGNVELCHSTIEILDIHPLFAKIWKIILSLFHRHPFLFEKYFLSQTKRSQSDNAAGEYLCNLEYWKRPLTKKLIPYGLKYEQVLHASQVYVRVLPLKTHKLDHIW